uniref:hypothetical protein n=1 Tax=Microbacterium sp. SORGH_AS_1204 TaxID=3041785 RepID=UPI0027D7E3C9|nr:hypothetical protein [Microbacterium sp. SORGH_AS_1204]
MTDPVEIAVGLNDAWTGCEWPTAYLSPDKWEQIFDRVGFVVDGQQATRPDHAVTAYRAAADGFAQGMSWTDDLRIALWFHRRNLSAGLDSAVYTARFDPRDLLGYFNYSTGEHEWVVRRTAVTDQLERVEIEDLSLPDRHPGLGL